jgi:hypothetical protein
MEKKLIKVKSVATFKPTGTLTFDEINEIATPPPGNTSSEERIA